MVTGTAVAVVPSADASVVFKGCVTCVCTHLHDRDRDLAIGLSARAWSALKKLYSILIRELKVLRPQARPTSARLRVKARTSLGPGPQHYVMLSHPHWSELEPPKISCLCFLNEINNRTSNCRWNNHALLPNHDGVVLFVVQVSAPSDRIL